MVLFVPKPDQHAPCFAISEKAYVTAFQSTHISVVYNVYFIISLLFFLLYHEKLHPRATHLAGHG